MSETPRSTSPSVKASADRLDSWKEIASYLNRDVTTVQRWEKREGMPVHRHLHDRMGSVYAFRAELDSWSLSRKLAPAQENKNETASSGLRTLAPPAVNPHRGRILLFALVGLVVLALAGSFWWQRSERSWQNPIAEARFQTIADFDGVNQAAAISRDGRFVAFLSDRDRVMDVWVTQVGSGEFHNLTRGSAPELVNPSVRTLGFSPDGSQVTFWARQQNAPTAGNISVWSIPTLGGQPKRYLEGVAEYDWSRDGTRLAYHTPGPGDPLFVSEGGRRPDDQPIFTAPAGQHSHFPLWSPDSTYLYFVQGTLPDKLDIWRLPLPGGPPERVTSHNARVSYPVLLDSRRLMYLASEPDGSGPWLYGMDLRYRVPHRLTAGLERYTSLAASADGRHLVVTSANPKRTLWRLPLNGLQSTTESPELVPLSTNSGFAPRLSAKALYYVSSSGSTDSLWRILNGAASELWSGKDAQIFGGPAVSPDGGFIAFSVNQHGQSLLYTIQADGTHVRVVTDAIDLQGDPAWTPDGQSIISGANDHGVSHLFRAPINSGSPISFVQEPSTNPVWAPDGKFLIYSGPDIGTTFSLKAVTADGAPHPLPPLTLTRGARHFIFANGGRSLLFLRGEIEHKNLWMVDLETGAERQLTNLDPGFAVRDFDISPDLRELILEREQERSEVAVVDLPAR